MTETTTTERNRLTGLTVETAESPALPVSLPDEVHAEMAWLIEQVQARGWSRVRIAKELGCDRTAAYAILNGTYGPPHGKGSWANVCARIQKLRARLGGQPHAPAKKGLIKFTENRNTKLIYQSLNYAYKNGVMVTVAGESGQGKTFAKDQWRAAYPQRRMYCLNGSVTGGARDILKDLAKMIGEDPDQSGYKIRSACYEFFNPDTLLVIDEAHLWLDGTIISMVARMEELRTLHDRTGCPQLWFITRRFLSRIKTKKGYQSEQLLGRFDLSVNLHKEYNREEVLRILTQVVKQPAEHVIHSCLQIANDTHPDFSGRLRPLEKILTVAHTLASAEGNKPCSNDHFWRAFKLRSEIKGEDTTTKKD